MDAPASRVFVVIPTHTPRHLETCLASLAWQARAPGGVVVTCDVVDSAIDRAIDAIWPRVTRSLVERGAAAPPLLHVSRAHAGEARLNQVRNNGLRAMIEQWSPLDHDLAVVLDGDTVFAPDAVGRHEALARKGADVVVAYRINLDESRTRLIDPEEILRFAPKGEMPAALLQAIHHSAPWMTQRQERYERQVRRREQYAWLPFTRVVKSHKPKILGGHHGVSFRALRAVNGYDEMYVGYGYDDDDLARRLYQVGNLKVHIAVADILAFHLWHPTRAPESPVLTPGYERFKRTDLPTRAEHGLDSPRKQATALVREIAGSGHRREPPSPALAVDGRHA